MLGIFGVFCQFGVLLLALVAKKYISQRLFQNFHHFVTAFSNWPPLKTVFANLPPFLSGIFKLAAIL
jgi:hypothetical protein